MNILHLEINDLKKISAIEIDPATGKPIILTGDNGQGKSSVLDAIVLALSNSGLDDPIRHGRPSGAVKLTLGAGKVEYLLERKITKSGDRLTLTGADGTPVAKPQTFLNGILGNYAFDPLEFTRLKPKAQVEALREAAGLDFTDIDAKRAEYYAERTTVNREGKEVAAQLEALNPPANDLPSGEVSIAVEFEKLREMEDYVRSVADLSKSAKDAFDERQNYEAKIRRVKDELELLTSAHKVADEKYNMLFNEHERAQSNCPTPEAIEAAKDVISRVDQTNQAIRNAITYKATEEKLKELRLKFANLNRRIEEIDEEKKESIKNANLPLDGLELTDEGVMVNGTFFSQLSTAEQIRVSALVAMSQNPTLKIIMIRDGALLNTSNLAMISSLAAERGVQVWIEKFQESASDVGLHIVDGAIAFENGEAVTELE